MSGGRPNIALSTDQMAIPKPIKYSKQKIADAYNKIKRH